MEMNMSSGVGLGLLIGAIPTACTHLDFTDFNWLVFPAMIFSEILLSNIEIGDLITAGFQNFAAGLILAAGFNSHLSRL